MTYAQLKAWIADPHRTQPELEEACTALSIAHGKYDVLADLRTLLQHAMLHKVDTDPAPAGPWNVPPPPPTAPPATNNNTGVPILLVIALAILALAGIIAAVIAFTRPPVEAFSPKANESAPITINVSTTVNVSSSVNLTPNTLITSSTNIVVPQPQPTPQNADKFNTTISTDSNSKSMSWTDFQNLAAGKDMYGLIQALDQQPQKEDHTQGGWTSTSSANQVIVVWTGSYIADVTYGGMVDAFKVDGKTGVWIQHSNTTVTWQTPGASITLDTGIQTTSAQQAISCIDTARIVDIINANKKTPNKIYIALDEIADTNPSARLRNEGPASYQVKNLQSLFWVRTGRISGPVLQIDSIESKSLYLATSDGTVSVSYAHSGLNLCTGLNPAQSFPWWGK